MLKPLTSLEPDPSAIKTIQVLPGNTLIGFHIKVSLEWDATDAEINDIRDDLTNASAFLYNASDGQFFFEQVDIDDDMQNWDGADYHIYANQSLRSNVPFDWDFADVQIEPGAIQMPRPPQVGVNSHFSDIRMFIHEFGHREYNLGDEYSDDDNTVQCTSQIAGAGATVPLFMPGGAASSCLMFDPISAKKFCSNRPQNPHVHGTSQGDDPCWSTIVNHFHDSHNPANWRLVTPDMSTVILGAINSGKIPLSDWNPKFVIHNHTRGLLCAPIFLTAKDEHGNLLLNEEMWTRTFYGQYLLQGNTNDKTGAGIWITGLHPDDQINSIPVTADQCTAISPFSLVTIIPHPAVYYSVRPTIIKGQVLVTVKVVDRKKPVLSIIQQERTGK